MDLTHAYGVINEVVLVVDGDTAGSEDDVGEPGGHRRRQRGRGRGRGGAPRGPITPKVLRTGATGLSNLQNQG